MASPARLARNGHQSHCKYSLVGLPSSRVEVDSSTAALAFYCIGTLDLLGTLGTAASEFERENWREWYWELQTGSKYGTGFRPSQYMTIRDMPANAEYEPNPPNLIMTYTSLLSLAMLRDDFNQLDRPGLLIFLRACQRDDGSFSALPGWGETDVRMIYCACVISSMLDDWSGVDIDKMVQYTKRCESYEGGYGQAPSGEALGGTTYCALASLALAPPTAASSRDDRIDPAHRRKTIRWVLGNQTPSGGFCGRTNKDADACYCFWCDASLRILGASDLVDANALAGFLGQCQFKFGGLSKAPSERPDPYHTYLSLAAVSICPPEDSEPSWKLPEYDALWNTAIETAAWAREHIRIQES